MLQEQVDYGSRFVRKNKDKKVDEMMMGGAGWSVVVDVDDLFSVSFLVRYNCFPTPSTLAYVPSSSGLGSTGNSHIHGSPSTCLTFWYMLP